MKKYIFFDNDNTLTRSRSPITPKMARLLIALSKKYEIIVVSGGSHEKQIGPQLGNSLRGKYWSMGQNGNLCMDKSGRVLWKNDLSWMQKLEIFEYANKIIKQKFYPYKNLADLVEDRGSQVSLSFVGNTAPIEEKEKFDPNKTIRAMVLKRFPFRSKSVEVKIAGTTCFDFFIKGYHKGKNIAALCKEMGWKKSECLYVGDALFKNGNDESVIGVIPTKKVRNPSDTEFVIADLLK